MRLSFIPLVGLRKASVFIVSMASCALAQTAAPTNQPPAAVRVQTVLITVPTLVSDKQGNPVEDLGKDDFIIRENGKQQAIAVFEHVKTTNAPIVQLTAPDGILSNTFKQDQPARLTIVAVDAISTGITEHWEVRKQITSFIARNISSNQPIALLVFHPTGLKVLHDFTTDPRVLAAALQQIKPSRTPAESIAADEELMRGRMDPRHGAAPDSFDRLVAEETGMIQSAFSEFTLFQKKRVVVNTLEAFHDIAEAFAGIPGRKSLIWISNGLSLSLGDPMTSREIGPHLMPYFDRTWRALNDSNIAVYPLDIADLINPGYNSPAFRVAQPFAVPTSRLYSMEELADRTGGRMCYRRDDLSSCFQKASHDSEDYYMLGYYGDPSNTKPGWRKVEVFVPMRQVKIRARNGYFLQRTRPDKEQMIMTDLRGAMGSPLEYTTFPIRVRLGPTAVISGEPVLKRVTFSFLVPPVGKFLSDDQALNLEFAALAKLPDATPAGQFLRHISGSLQPAIAAEIAAKGVVLDGSIDLPPGEYQVKFVVRDNQTGRLGSVSTAVKVPAVSQ